MQDLRGPMNSESARSAIDRHAVTAVAQVLVSAIWLEHRILRASSAFQHVAESASIRCVCGELHRSSRIGPWVAPS